MSEDIFDHPDLQDPRWDKLVKKEKRRGFWRRNRLRTAIWLVLIVAVPGLVLYTMALDSTPVKAPDPVISPPTTTGPAVATEPPPVRREVNLAAPFAGTPAQDWADGEAGMAMPPATAVDGFSADEVAEALTKMRQAFIAGHLDPAVIQDDKVDSYVVLFAKDMREEIRTNPEHHIRIAPSYRLMNRPAKVNGKFDIKSGKAGEIVVWATFSVVYAFEPEHGAILDDPMDILTVYRANQQYVFRKGKAFATSSQGLWLGTSDGYVYSVSCAASKQGMIAPAYRDRSSGGAGQGATSEDKDRAFSPAGPMPTGSTC